MQLGALHYAVNNAGKAGSSGALSVRSRRRMGRVVNVNLNALHYGMKTSCPAMKLLGGGAIRGNNLRSSMPI